MKLYFAPMEGITNYTFRNAHAEMFGGVDKYYAPFIVPTENERISRRTLRDIVPEYNIAPIVPQVLCNCNVAFAKFTEKILPLGYDELNINFGCPASTVVGKKRGSGALTDTLWLDKLLEKIFENPKITISVKTRVGFKDHAEFDEILKVYNKYPISLLIVHPRVREEFYKGTPNIATFEKAYNESNLKLCYNGNIYRVSDYENIASKFPNTDSIMIGRGAIANPAIFREIRGGAPLKTAELIAFSKLLEERYLALFNSDIYTLQKLKEVWIYALLNFPEEKRIIKAVKKAARLSDLNSAINSLPEITENR